MNFRLKFSHLLFDLGEIFYKRLENNVVEHYEPHKNWHREDHTLLMGISEITFMHVLPSFAVYPPPSPSFHFDS